MAVLADLSTHISCKALTAEGWGVLLQVIRKWEYGMLSDTSNVIYLQVTLRLSVQLLYFTFFCSVLCLDWLVVMVRADLYAMVWHTTIVADHTCGIRCPATLLVASSGSGIRLCTTAASSMNPLCRSPRSACRLR